MDLSEPIDVATRHSANFIASNLAPGSDVIEVGCGNGHLAVELTRRGFDLTAIDADPDCVAHARSLGVLARTVEWPAYEGRATHAVAFTRSLHHIHALHEAVAHAARLTRAGGMLILEDFAPDAPDPRHLDWFTGVLLSPRAAALIAAPADGLAASLLSAQDRPAAWRHYHTAEHELHAIGAMRNAIAREFSIQFELEVPYLYRYLIPLVPRTRDAAGFIDDVFSDEAARAADHELVPVGRRIIATR